MEAEEAYLDDILAKLGEMKKQSRVMSVHLDDTNRRLEDLNDQVSECQMRAKNLTTKAEKVRKNL